MDALFERFNAQFARPFENWARRNLDFLGAADVLFYPFSGPDIIYAKMACPLAKNFVLCGLEPCSVRTPSAQHIFPNEQLADLLEDLSVSLQHFLEHSYFITTEMHEHLVGTDLHSVLPLLLVFLARTGNEILHVSPFQLSEDGGVVLDRETSGEDSGLWIQFQGSAGIQNLYYLRRDLRNEYFGKTATSFFSFIHQMGRPVLFSKSASYLLHEPNFSVLRDFILKEGRAIIQDPSNIPYQMFGERGWKVELHGSYQRAPLVFPQYEQPELLKATHEPSVNFGFGYLFKPEIASLMIATPAEFKY